MSGMEWAGDAACRGMDVNIFFPDKGDYRAAQAAKDVCRSCSVMTQCADYALERREMWGIWGGLTDDDRRVMLGMVPHSRARRAAV